jgi:hypothetical protein
MISPSFPCKSVTSGNVKPGFVASAPSPPLPATSRTRLNETLGDSRTNAAMLDSPGKLASRAIISKSSMSTLSATSAI